ncbi:nuclease Le1 [Phanerochaete sordida]|uniref:Nuclease Le1 n=1 Tax=Phanerochaete sordida TaxID=48140 RepID=A0A9P3GEP6_9APHY|nr:nuclease Le1 [Phanerochaete sordida]
MKHAYVLATLAALNALPAAIAWGVSGHHAVGLVAEQFLSKNAQAFVSDILGESYHSSLALASTWADSVRDQPEYKWSAELHYMNTKDSPRTNSCTVELERDCPGGRCIVAAMGNYTWHLLQAAQPRAQAEEALKFLIHFLGDVGQPLHTEALALGGYQLPVICEGQVTNLHWVWDEAILDSRIVRQFHGSVRHFASWLVRDMKHGAMSRTVASWYKTPWSLQSYKEQIISDSEAQAPFYNAVYDEDTYLEWTREANAHACTTVFDYRMREELCEGRYANMAFQVIIGQIAKQGYRLAQTLNDIVDAVEPELRPRF